MAQGVLRRSHHGYQIGRYHTTPTPDKGRQIHPVRPHPEPERAACSHEDDRPAVARSGLRSPPVSRPFTGTRSRPTAGGGVLKRDKTKQKKVFRLHGVGCYQRDHEGHAMAGSARRDRSDCRCRPRSVVIGTDRSGSKCSESEPPLPASLGKQGTSTPTTDQEGKANLAAL